MHSSYITFEVTSKRKTAVVDRPVCMSLFVAMLSCRAKDAQQNVVFAIVGIATELGQVGNKNIFALVILGCCLLVVDMFNEILSWYLL